MNITRTKILTIGVALGFALTVIANPQADLMVWTDNIQRYRTLDNLVYVSILYMICIAVPFMPGVEIGLLLMLVFGKAGVIAAYVCTSIGLNMAFATGRVLGMGQLGPYLHERCAAARCKPDVWLQSALDRSPALCRILHLSGRRMGNLRYLTVGILLNVPGNSVLGGGGGIALLSGMNGSFSWLKFVITVAVATLFVPLVVFLGIVNIESLINGVS